MRSATPLLLVAPALLYLAFFLGYPIASAVITGFTDDEGRFTLEHVRFLLYSPLSEFRDALFYTLLLAALVIPVEAAIALLATMLLLEPFRGRDAMVYLLALPIAISDVAAGLIWYSMLTGKGFLNKLLMAAGLIEDPIIFFGYEYKWRMILAIFLAEVWRSTAIVFIVVFAGAQLIHRDLMEAAEVFGAGFWVKFTRILVPLVKPSLQAALIIRTLFALQVFATVWILAGRDIPVLAGEAYYSMVQLHYPAAASLYALVIAVLSAALSLAYLRLLRAGHLEAGR